VAPAYFNYTGHSLGPVGSIVAAVGIALRLGWMFWRRRNRG
jgi:LPXTG-motif cell wall-anchored protein